MYIVHCTSTTSGTVVATAMDMTVKLGITLPKSVMLKIDHQRGDIPRSRYIRRAIETYLGSNSSKNIDNDNYNRATTKKRRRK
jgi:metal-responsive CopG/Arc/MetJ family transcriptional regulator